MRADPRSIADDALSDQEYSSTQIRFPSIPPSHFLSLHHISQDNNNYVSKYLIGFDICDVMFYLLHIGWCCHTAKLCAEWSVKLQDHSTSQFPQRCILCPRVLRVHSFKLA